MNARPTILTDAQAAARSQPTSKCARRACTLPSHRCHGDGRAVPYGARCGSRAVGGADHEGRRGYQRVVPDPGALDAATDGRAGLDDRCRPGAVCWLTVVPRAAGEGRSGWRMTAWWLPPLERSSGCEGSPVCPSISGINTRPTSSTPCRMSCIRSFRPPVTPRPVGHGALAVPHPQRKTVPGAFRLEDTQGGGWRYPSLHSTPAASGGFKATVSRRSITSHDFLSNGGSVIALSILEYRWKIGSPPTPAPGISELPAFQKLRDAL